MSETTGSFSSKDKCEVCARELVAGQNWHHRFARKGKTICIECYEVKKKQAYEQRQKAKSPQGRIDILIERLRDEDRIERLVEWIKEINLDRAQRNHIQEAIKNADLNRLDHNEAELKAREECAKWTYEDIKDRKQLDYLVMAKVLAMHKITVPENGDMSATWHIALSECGYEQYELDADGLPLAKPGMPRLKVINYARKNADKFALGKRFGIVAVRVSEPERRSRKEWRICLCKTEQVYNKVRDSRIARHEGEIKSESELVLSMKDDISRAQDAVERYVDLFNRTRE